MIPHSQAPDRRATSLAANASLRPAHPNVTRQSSAKRAGDAFVRIFGQRTRRRRESLFPSIGSESFNQVDLLHAQPVAFLPAPHAPFLTDAARPLSTRPSTQLLPPPPHALVTHDAAGGSDDHVLDDDDYDWLHAQFAAPKNKHMSARARPARPDSLTLPRSAALRQARFAADDMPRPGLPPHRPRHRPLQANPKPKPKPKTTALSAQRYQGAGLADLLAGVRRIDLGQERHMTTLQIALLYTLRNEGSAFVNNPSDHGGPTRYGITLNTLSRYMGHAAQLQDVQNISMATVTAIYQKLYWGPIKAAQIQDQRLATALFDVAVLSGNTAAVKMIQACVDVAIDGAMGPATLAAINAQDPQALLLAMSLKACTYFQAIALRDSSQAQFLTGWTIRAHRMLAQTAISV